MLLNVRRCYMPLTNWDEPPRSTRFDQLGSFGPCSKNFGWTALMLNHAWPCRAAVVFKLLFSILVAFSNSLRRHLALQFQWRSNRKMGGRVPWVAWVGEVWHMACFILMRTLGGFTIWAQLRQDFFFDPALGMTHRLLPIGTRGDCCGPRCSCSSSCVCARWFTRPTADCFKTGGIPQKWLVYVGL